MPDLMINIGGRGFSVSCQPGEEHFLSAAAAILDAEAQPILSQMGRLPEARMLLMAGLMIADRVAAQEDELRQLRARVADADVPVIPPIVTESYAELAARVEAMAAAVEDRLAERGAQPAGE